MYISVKNVDKYYGKVKVFEGISVDFDLDNRNIYGLIGPNGAGKTTLLKLLSGILLFSNGEIQLTDSTNVDYSKWCRSNVAYIFAGERGLRIKNTVYDNVIYYGILKGSDIKLVKNNLDKFAELLGFSDLIYRRIEQLSTGEKKKAAILCGLCSNMHVLILDEPSLGLDIEATKHLQDMLKQIVKEFYTTMIISSHDVNFLSTIAKKYIFMFKGSNIFPFNDEMDGDKIIKTYFEMKGIYGENGNAL